MSKNYILPSDEQKQPLSTIRSFNEVLSYFPPTTVSDSSRIMKRDND